MRRALVTGASGAIGGAIARLLAERGLELVLHAHRNVAAVERLADELRRSGAAARAVAFDLADEAATQGALAPLLEERAIQVLVHNAGIHDDAPLPGMPAAQWHRVIDVSLHGFFHAAHALAMPMARTRWGRIISITSVSAALGTRGQANYAAAKAGVEAASRSLARELGPRGVTVNCVAPGIVDSAMSRAAFDEARIRALVPLQRAATPGEIAAVVGFLASDAAGYITGQVVPVNGGLT